MYYRDGEFFHADADTGLRAGDEAVILTHSRNIGELEKRWPPRQRVAEGRDEGSVSAAGEP